MAKTRYYVVPRSNFGSSIIKGQDGPQEVSEEFIKSEKGRMLIQKNFIAVIKKEESDEETEQGEERQKRKYTKRDDLIENKEIEGGVDNA